jgi:hypothetical protein
MILYNPTGNMSATIFLVGKLQIRNTLWFLKGAKWLRNIYDMNVIKDLEHQQMCRLKKEKSCTMDAESTNNKTQKLTISK